MKKCPFCAEAIQDEAIVCRYCRRDLPAHMGVDAEAGRSESRAPLSPTPLPRPPITTQSHTGRNIGCSAAIIIIIVLVNIATFSDAIQRTQFKAAHPYPTTSLSCPKCSPGIPIYDSWSADRKVDAYGRDGEECEVHQNYIPSYLATLQPGAAYPFIAMEPHLYLACPSGHGFVCTSQTTHHGE